MSQTPVSEYNKCVKEGGNNTGYGLCHGRLTCGSSPSIDDEEGFAGVTRNGVGDYTIEFDEAFSSPPHCWAVAEGSSDAYNIQLHSQPTITSMRVLCFGDAGSADDPTAIHAFALGA